MASQVTNNLPSRPRAQKLGAPKGLPKLNKAPGIGQATGAVNGVGGQATNAVNQAAQSVPSAYEIMAGRIANRVAEMAENITFVERPRQSEAPLQETDPATGKKRPRKLDIRLGTSTKGDVSFSPAFLDSLLSKMLTLQARMLKVSNELGGVTDVEEETKKEQYEQTSELSRIIALICAEKARQGA
ncbi:hypothetical protein EV356DRAFT_519061 [Viridothelium virens]|uniref:Uncharacterized protein n=1 Tax=Viridothelium virens TaxID=1048519 RepID=A0A6A6H008_VIRVR|nr:hypothetical protein EV356DRAFT_519061 [Viridothelium virens]